MPTITLPLPDSRMSGHAKGHWRPKAALTKSMRRTAYLIARDIKLESMPYERAVINFAFYLKTRQRRDTLNLMHACKPAIDGLVDSGWIVDDDWKVLTVGRAIVDVDKVNPRCEIEIVEAA